MIKLSIIIPIYNVAPYLKRCIQSCENQNISQNEYELILINDGSTDNSLEIANSLKNEYSNIKVFSKENGGLSSARNLGMEVSQGMYIWFVDSDDWIENNVLKQILDECIKYSLDVLWLKWSLINEQGKLLPLTKESINGDSTDVMIGSEFINSVLGVFLFACTFIYKREFLKKNGWKFRDGIYFEDTDFNFKVLPNAQKIKYLPLNAYCYFQRKDSICHSISSKKLYDLFEIMRQANIQRRQHTECAKYFYHFVSYQIIAINIILSPKKFKEERIIFLKTLTDLKIDKIELINARKTYYYLHFLYNHVSHKYFSYIIRILLLFKRLC